MGIPYEFPDNVSLKLLNIYRALRSIDESARVVAYGLATWKPQIAQTLFTQLAIEVENLAKELEKIWRDP